MGVVCHFPCRFFIRRIYFKRASATAGDEQLLARYQARIEKDLEKLD